MAKPLSFKDMMTVNHRPGEDELVSYQAHKRRRGQGAGSNAEYSSTNPPRKEVETEALSMRQRRMRSLQLKRMKNKIKIGRERAKRRMATKDTLLKRTMKQARNQIFKKLAKRDKGAMGYVEREKIEKRMSSPAIKKRIEVLAKRMYKDVRKKEVARKKG